MKKWRKGRFISLLLAAALLFTGLPETVHAAQLAEETLPKISDEKKENVVGKNTLPQKMSVHQSSSTRAARETIAQLKARFPAGRYWNRVGLTYNNPDGVTGTLCPSTHDTAPDTCNNYRGYAQCWGFAYRLADGYYGSCPADGWSAGSLDSLKAGDIIRYNTGGEYGHTIWVIGVSGDTITFADCNADYHCGIRWDQLTTKSYLRAAGILNLFSAPYSITTEPAPAPEPERGQEMTGPFTRTISDGDYHIVSALEGNCCKPGTKCLTIGGLPGNKNTSESNAELWGVSGHSDHVFTVTWIDEAHGYKIKLKSSANQYLDVHGADTAMGANVQQYEGNGSIAQQWSIREMSDGNGYGIQARCSGYYLDVTEGNTADGTNIRLWGGNETVAQRWYFVPWGGGNSAVQSIPDGEYEIVSKPDSSKVLGSDGENIALYNRGNEGRHVFLTTYLGQGYYKIVSKNTGRTLDVAYGESKRGALIIEAGYWGSYNEQWLIKDCGGGDYLIISRCNGLCVDVADAVMKDGQEIHVWSYEGLENQKWKFVPYKQPTPDTPDPDNPHPDQPEPDKPEPDHPAPDKPGEDDTDQGEVLDEDIPDGGIAKIPHGLWMSEIADQPYTGKPVKPAVRVYDYKKLLTEKKDYKISYKNNRNAAAASDTKAPTITVTGRGNYSGKDTQTFTITPKSLADEDVFAYDMAAKYTGRIIKSAPTVVWSGKQLSKNRDYTYQDGIYSTEGTYQVIVKGKGNFCGERTAAFTITRGRLASAFRVTKPANCLYTGKPVTPKLTVKDGSVTLREGTDFKVTYRNNIKIGTAEALVTGMGDYAGVKKVSFKILPAVSLNKADAELTFDNGAFYTGNEVKPTACRVTVKGRDAAGNVTTTVLTEGEDYEVSFRNNIKAGTATITFHGINACSGTLKKKYRIAAYDVAGAQLEVSMEDAYAYVKGGCKPEPVVTFRGKTLTKGTDYTLAYKNSTALADGSDPQKQPAVIIRGRGCFTGSLEKNYRITTKDMSALTMKAADRTWQNRKNIYRTKITIQDTDGKKLSAGRDYDKVLRYEYNAETVLADGTVRSAGTEISGQDIIPAGTVIRVTAFAKGTQYTGQASCCYRITKMDIGRAKVTIPAQIYTGREIRPNGEIKITLNGQVLSAENYEVTGYRNNINKGRAAVTIQGRNDCGGTKTVRFTIKRKGFLWWWR